MKSLKELYSAMLSSLQSFDIAKGKGDNNLKKIEEDFAALVQDIRMFICRLTTRESSEFFVLLA